jgi:hypothetical protein
MYKPELSRFQYTRKHGQRRTYNVTLNVVQKDSGVCAYAAWVQFGAEFKGSGLMLPLVAATRDDAVQEARIRIQNMTHAGQMQLGRGRRMYRAWATIYFNGILTNSPPPKVGRTGQPATLPAQLLPAPAGEYSG